MDRDNNTYDLIIIGGGPAGLTASIYASRYKLRHLIFSKEPGGQLNEIHKIENYPGYVSISGYDLAQKMIEQTKTLGGEIKMESIAKIEKKDDFFEVSTSTENYLAKNILLTVGTEYRKMNISGEKELKGKGVSYCATCDAAFFTDKKVCVVGGANSAAMAALLLAEYAAKIYVIYRGAELRCDPVYLEKIKANEKITVIYETNISEIKGTDKVEEIILDREYDSSASLSVDGVFIEIGSEPGVELVRELGVETDEKSFIKINADQSTNIPGVYAAGDVTTGSNGMRQVITAAAEGAIAAGSIYKRIQVTS
jgi:thioredoxin reductase (NADPH)